MAQGQNKDWGRLVFTCPTFNLASPSIQTLFLPPQHLIYTHWSYLICSMNFLTSPTCTISVGGGVKHYKSQCFLRMTKLMYKTKQNCVTPPQKINLGGLFGLTGCLNMQGMSYLQNKMHFVPTRELKTL